MYKHFFKRVLDILISGIGLICISPVLLVLAILVRIKLGSPVIFKQERPGLNEQIFTLKKFRTMTDARDGEGNLLPDAERLTKFGKFLRSTSLDELPELWNIFCGDMSLIGPRPLLVSYLPYYTDREKLRHTVRPGLTGLAQVSAKPFAPVISIFIFLPQIQLINYFIETRLLQIFCRQNKIAVQDRPFYTNIRIIVSNTQLISRII